MTILYSRDGQEDVGLNVWTYVDPGSRLADGKPHVAEKWQLAVDPTLDTVTSTEFTKGGESEMREH